jgi:glycosyltransferase involved in cell wall biosynthesis
MYLWLGSSSVVSRKLLVLDAAFSYEAIVNRGLVNSVICRDLDGYFDHVWSVHPFASLVSSRDWSPEFGRPVAYAVSNQHTFIEGKVGLTANLKKYTKVNFFLAQLDMLIFLTRLIRKEKINVIRTGDPLYLGAFGFFLSKLTRIPFVVRVGSNNEKIRESTGKCMMPRLFKTMKQERLVEKFVLSRADLVAGANKDNMEFAIDAGAQPNKCTLFRYGNLIDPAHFVAPSHRLNADNLNLDGPFLMCIARLEPVKKVDDVIRVLAEVRKRGFIVRALLVGDGSERDNLKQLAEKLGVLSQVSFCGNRDQSWLSSTIPHAAVVLSPHTGRALAEAALGAAPIAAYDVDWQAELIKTGITGEIVPFGNWQALATSTIKLLSDQPYARRVGEKLRERVLEMMDPDKLDEHERQQYEKLLQPAK